MKPRALKMHPGLSSSSRLTRLRNSLWKSNTEPPLATEIAFLFGCGVLVALSVLLPEWKLQTPGHSALRSVFGMAFGLALVPRLGAGTVMGMGAITTAAICRGMGYGKEGIGSLTTLCLTGPCLDLALCYVRSGPWLYVGLMGGGLLANTTAFAVQYSDKVWHWTRWLSGGGGAGGGMGTGGGGGRGLPAWLALASWTCPLFGIAAGLISALIFFRFRALNPSGESRA